MKYVARYFYNGIGNVLHSLIVIFNPKKSFEKIMYLKTLRFLEMHISVQTFL